MSIKSGKNWIFWQALLKPKFIITILRKRSQGNSYCNNVKNGFVEKYCETSFIFSGFIIK